MSKRTKINWTGLDGRIVLNIGMLLIVVIVVITFTQVILRYCFGRPLEWVEEMARFFEAWIIFLGSYYTFKKGTHVSVDYFIKKMPRKMSRKIHLVTTFLVLIFLSVVMQATVTLIREIWGNTSSATGYPAPLLPAALFLGVLGMVVESVKQIFRLLHGQTAIEGGEL